MKRPRVLLKKRAEEGFHHFFFAQGPLTSNPRTQEHRGPGIVYKDPWDPCYAPFDCVAMELNYLYSC